MLSLGGNQSKQQKMKSSELLYLSVYDNTTALQERDDEMLCIASISIEIVVDNKRGVEDDDPNYTPPTESFFHKLENAPKFGNEKATILLLNEFIIPTQFI